VDGEASAAMALAFTGDSGRSRKIASDLEQDFPEDLLVQRNFLPTIRAKIVLGRGDADRAIELLHLTAPYELGPNERAALMDGTQCIPYM